MRLFPVSSRRRRSHGHWHYSPPNLHNFSIDSLVILIEKPLGVHRIRTKLYSLPIQRLNSLFDVSKSTLLPDSNSPIYSHWHHSWCRSPQAIQTRTYQYIYWRKQSCWAYISLIKDLMLTILPIYFIISRCRQMFQLILNNRLHLLFLTNTLQPLHPKFSVIVILQHLNIDNPRLTPCLFLLIITF